MEFHLHWADIFTGANLLLGLAIYRKATLIVYQHKLLWEDFCKRTGISPKANGASVGSE